MLVGGELPRQQVAMATDFEGMFGSEERIEIIVCLIDEVMIGKVLRVEIGLSYEL